MSRNLRGTLPLVIVIVSSIVVLDQITKEIMIREIGPDAPRRVIEIVPGVLDFRFVRNTGSAFGMFQGQSSILAVLAIGAISFLALYFLREARENRLVAAAIGLQIGGAIGNVVDRFRHGYVVDFIDFPRFPTFNVADSAITVGVILLIYAVLFKDLQDARAQADEPLRSGGDDS